MRVSAPCMKSHCYHCTKKEIISTSLQRMKFWRMTLSLAGGFSVVQALLAELPAQFLTYVRSRNIQPSL